MTFKVVEIRDEGTCILALAIQMQASSEILAYYVHTRSCYPRDGSSIMLMILMDGRATSDPYQWVDLHMGPRTMPVAHNWIIEHYEEVQDGDVVDVQFILGETVAPKVSERGAL